MDFKEIQHECHAIVRKPDCGISFGTIAFQLKTERNLKWRKFNTKIIELGSLQVSVKCWKTFN
jgi:hypothetical protein